MNDLKRAFFVNVLDKAFYAALIAEIVFYYFIAALVAKLYVNARVEERLLAQTAFKNRIVVFGGFLKDKRIGFKTDLGALYIGLTGNFKVVYDFAALETLKVNVLAVADLNLKPL